MELHLEQLPAPRILPPAVHALVLTVAPARLALTELMATAAKLALGVIHARSVFIRREYEGVPDAVVDFRGELVGGLVRLEGDSLSKFFFEAICALEGVLFGVGRVRRRQAPARHGAYPE